MNEHYRAVLEDLQRRRATLEAQISEIDAAIAPLRRLSFSSLQTAQAAGEARGQSRVVAVSETTQDETKAEPRYANMSVRWAVLWHLSEFVDGWMRTGEITNALKAGGYTTESSHFGNAVSAVLSGMKAKGEVEASDDGAGYRITDAGRQMWANIRQGRRFSAISSTEPPLLSVQ